MGNTVAAKGRSGKGSVPRSFRFSPEFVRLLDELAQREGLTNTGYLEMTIRRLAREVGPTTDDRTHASSPPPSQARREDPHGDVAAEDAAYEKRLRDKRVAQIAALAEDGAITAQERDLLVLSESEASGEELSKEQVEAMIALRRRIGLR